MILNCIPVWRAPVCELYGMASDCVTCNVRAQESWSACGASSRLRQPWPSSESIRQRTQLSHCARRDDTLH